MDVSNKQKKDDGCPSICKLSVSKYLKPLNRNNILYYYVPAIGTASYTTLSISVLNPTLSMLLPKRDLTNVLLFNSLVGAGCYIYSRPHIALTDKNNRMQHAVLGSTVFCFSSVLLWAILRSVLPESVFVCTAAGLTSSYILVKGTTNYLQFVDDKITGKK